MTLPGDDEHVIDDLRELLIEHGLLEDAQVRVAPDDASSERVFARALMLAEARKRPRRTRLLAAAAAVVATLGGLGTWAVVGGAQPAMASPPALEYSAHAPADLADAAPATDALALAARRAAASTPPREGDVQFVAISEWLASFDADAGTMRLEPTQTSTWLYPDGSARVEQQRGQALDPDGRLAPAESPTGWASSVDVVPAGTLDPAIVAHLPRTTNSLRSSLLDLSAGMQCSSDAEQAWCLADQIRQLYSRNVIPADLAAALWDVLAAEPAVRDLGEAKDRLGRTVHAVAVRSPASSSSDMVLTLLVAPDTGRLVGTETTTLHDEAFGITEPTVTEFQTWLDARFVAGAPGQ